MKPGQVVCGYPSAGQFDDLCDLRTDRRLLPGFADVILNQVNVLDGLPHRVRSLRIAVCVNDGLNRPFNALLE